MKLDKILVGMSQFYDGHLYGPMENKTNKKYKCITVLMLKFKKIHYFDFPNEIHQVDFYM